MRRMVLLWNLCLLKTLPGTGKLPFMKTAKERTPLADSRGIEKRETEKRKKESVRSRRREKSGKPRKRGMISLRNGKILANGQSRKSNIPPKRRKRSREVWPGFYDWNRRNIRILETSSEDYPWIGKRWKWIWIPLTTVIITTAWNSMEICL